MRDMAGNYRVRRLWRHAAALFRCDMRQPGEDVSRSGIYFGWTLLIASSFGNIARNTGLCPAVSSDAIEIVLRHIF